MQIKEIKHYLIFLKYTKSHVKYWDSAKQDGDRREAFTNFVEDNFLIAHITKNEIEENFKKESCKNHLRYRASKFKTH